MRILIIHPEAEYFAGAEKLLGYFLEEAARLKTARIQAGAPLEIEVARVPGARIQTVIPPEIRTIDVNENRRFSPFGLMRQSLQIWRAHRRNPYDLIHGWAIRGWELSTVTGKLARRAAIGTIHDHPQARFISPKRQRLMRWCASSGLRQVVCISHAVSDACRACGYPPDHLAVVHNGIPIHPRRSPVPWSDCCRLAFMGALSERKGIRALFALIDKTAGQLDLRWELHMAGEALDDPGRALMREIRNRYASHSWWSQVVWHGWVNNPIEFLENKNLLLCPSSEFEPFGLVVCEAALAGLPAMATRLGGLPEIIVDEESGWLFDPANLENAARILARIMSQPELLSRVAAKAQSRITEQFNIQKMVEGYRNVYSKFIRENSG
ncbi:MAG TPA: glycosyltransferase family 4 protein [Candidatus Paceibacterota bacterium]|nr:glycosyltransferase family 4 protein [Verrucomicrobiota bacterium]HRY51407.1 glycosyltransferase family 4 protein [Candidatus Paceibacterota bacterium]HSA00022.1 glycosyltransferase family 4 protein [Candidatus Paceibacterota bacterium]